MSSSLFCAQFGASPSYCDVDEETSPEPSLTSGCAVGGGNFNYRWKTPADPTHFQLKCQWVVVKSVGRGFVFSTSVPSSPCRVHEVPREQPPCRCSDSPCVEGRPAVGAAYLPSGPCGERRGWGRQEVWPEAGQNKQNKKEKKCTADWPLNAIACCVAEAPDVIVVAVHRASASKHQAVTRQTRNLQQHNLIT